MKTEISKVDLEYFIDVYKQQRIKAGNEYVNLSLHGGDHLVLYELDIKIKFLDLVLKDLRNVVRKTNPTFKEWKKQFAEITEKKDGYFYGGRFHTDKEMYKEYQYDIKIGW